MIRVDMTQTDSLAGTGRPEEPKGSRAESPKPPHRAQQLEASPAPATIASHPAPQHSLSIQVDEHQRVFYQVIDARTGEVVRQLPPEEVRRAGRQIDELLRQQETSVVRQIDIKS